MGTDRRTINAYRRFALKWREKLRSGKNTAHTYLEKPAMFTEVPPLRGKSVLCVGCGTGEECFYLKSKGARRVVGIDVVDEMINQAKKRYAGIEFQIMDMERIKFPPATFDFVYSSLALHYVKDWGKTLRGIFRILKNGGIFLFSTHHPIKWGALETKTKAKKSILMGYVRYSSGAYQIFGDYLNARKIQDTWFGELKVRYYHRPLSKIIKDILRCGFQIAAFLEPKPIASVSKIDRSFWQIRQKIPLFMIFKLRKPFAKGR